MTRVVVVAASPVARAGLEAMLAAQPDLTVVGAVASGAPLAGLAADVAVLLFDDDAPDGLPSVLLMDDVTPGRILELLRGGARAVLPSDANAEELAAAVRAAALGLVVLPALDAEPVLAAAATRAPAVDLEALTPRESEILGLLSGGLSNKEIAARLAISDHTVKFHIASIMAKLGAGTRTEAVTIGLRHGLILL